MKSEELHIQQEILAMLKSAEKPSLILSCNPDVITSEQMTGIVWSKN